MGGMALKEKARTRAIAPLMRIALVATGAIVAIGLGAAGWLSIATPTPAGPGAAPAVAVPAAPAGAAASGTPVAGSEVLPPAEPAPGGLPRTWTTPRVQAPLPASSSATGELVAGYPTDLAAPAPGSEVLDTSVASDVGAMQFTLRARTDEPIEEVIAYYRSIWSGLGLAAATDADASYRDDYSAVTISAQATGTGSTYTVSGVLRTG